MDIKKLSESLNPTERKVVKVLDNFSSFHDIIKVTGLKDVEVMRALQWLQNKNIIKTKEEQKELVHLDENGQKYLKYVQRASGNSGTASSTRLVPDVLCSILSLLGAPF